jgi:hypothetical protein
MGDDGLGQGPLVGTMADEEAAMRKGKGGQLVILGGLAVALIGGLFFLMGSDDQQRVYGELGKKINGLKQSQFDQFWGCALDGEDLRDVKSNSDLMAQLDARGREKGAAYGAYLRDTCLPKIADLGPELETLILPPELTQHVQAMTEANASMRAGVSAFVAYLDHPELDYESSQSRPFIKDTVKGWYDFKKAYSATNDVIREQLNE